MRQVIILAVALVAALLGSYFTWNAPSVDDDADAKVKVYAMSPSKIDALAWASDAVDVTVTKKSDDLGDYYHVDLTERRTIRTRIEPDPEDEEAPEDEEDEESPEGEESEGEDEEPPEPQFEERIETETFAYTANSAAEELWEAFGPLMALRELEDAQPFDYEGEKSATITVSGSGGETILNVAAESTYGGKDRYVKNGSKVFLVDDATLRPLQFAKSRLIERDLHPFKQEDVDKVVVEFNGQERTFLQKNKDDRKAAYWEPEQFSVDPAEQIEIDPEVLDAWFAKVFRMKVQNYEPTETPESDLKSLFTITLHGDDGKAYAVEFFEDPEGDATYRATSAFNRANVALTESLAADAIADVETLF